MTPDFEVEMRSCGASGVTAQGNDLPPSHLFSFLDPEGGEVCVHRDDVPWVVNPDHAPVSPHGPHEPNSPPRHGPDLGAIGDPDVDSSMKARREPPESDAIRRDERARHGPSREHASFHDPQAQGQEKEGRESGPGFHPGGGIIPEGRRDDPPRGRIRPGG